MTSPVQPAPVLHLRISVFACLLLLLDGCGGGGGGGGAPPPSTPTTSHLVTISWAPNHERAVEVDPGGGYIVNITGQAPITCPVTGFSAPCTSAHSVQLTLMTGTYNVTVTAFSALNAPGSTTGSSSTPSSVLVVNVP